MTLVRQAMADKCHHADPTRWQGLEAIPPDDRLPHAELLRRIHRFNIAYARHTGRRHHAGWTQAQNTILAPQGYGWGVQRDAGAA